MEVWTTWAQCGQPRSGQKLSTTRSDHPPVTPSLHPQLTGCFEQQKQGLSPQPTTLTTTALFSFLLNEEKKKREGRWTSGQLRSTARSERSESQDPDAAITPNALRWDSRDGRPKRSPELPAISWDEFRSASNQVPPASGGPHPERRRGAPTSESPARSNSTPGAGRPHGASSVLPGSRPRPKPKGHR